MGREVLNPSLGGIPKGSTPGSFKTRENNLKEVARGSFVTSVSATTLDLIEAFVGNVMVVVNLGS